MDWVNQKRSRVLGLFAATQLSGRQQKEFYVFPFYLFPQDFSDKFCFASEGRGQVSYWLLLSLRITQGNFFSKNFFTEAVRDPRVRHQFG